MSESCWALTWDDEQPDGLTVTSEHLERLDSVTVGHSALQKLVPDLELDFLEIVRHGVTRPRPLRVHIHHSEDSLNRQYIVGAWLFYCQAQSQLPTILIISFQRLVFTWGSRSLSHSSSVFTKTWTSASLPFLAILRLTFFVTSATILNVLRLNHFCTLLFNFWWWCN